VEEKPIPDRLLEILACPACESRPKVTIVDGAIRCSVCGRTYSIENGIPIMLVEKAAGGKAQ
jgi:uncharacterized protein YbaR (Trm112 family)